jgi:hypothetical protein
MSGEPSAISNSKQCSVSGLQHFALAICPKPFRALLSKHWNFRFYSLIGVSGAS